VIAYFDTSAIVTLLVDEAGTAAAGRIWDRAERLVSIRLARVEARAALAQATRLGRITPQQLRTSKRALEELAAQLDVVEIDEDLVDRASDLAEHHSLRAYDAVHLAAVRRVLDQDLVFVAGDRALLAAARVIGISVAPIG
jgi:predicted nucleic acid-binding protein